MAGRSVSPLCALNLQEGSVLFGPRVPARTDKVLIDQLFQINEEPSKILC